MPTRYTQTTRERQAKALLALIFTLCASVASAQPNCRSVVLPDRGGWGLQTPEISHHIVYVPPPTAEERWGKLTYPINYVYGMNSSALSVGLMYLMAKTYVAEGWQVVDRFNRPDLDRTKRYVRGQSGAWYPWVPNGIRFVWYPILSMTAPVGEEPTWAFRVTIDKGDAQEIDGALSTVMQRNEGVSLGVNVMYPYPEPIQVEVALHLRECY